MLDGALLRGIAQFCNTRVGGIEANNAILVQVPGRYLTIEATRDLLNGEEIFLYYGPAYYENDGCTSVDKGTHATMSTHDLHEA
jgi:hypothetical protein